MDFEDGFYDVVLSRLLVNHLFEADGSVLMLLRPSIIPSDGLPVLGRQFKESCPLRRLQDVLHRSGMLNLDFQHQETIVVSQKMREIVGCHRVRFVEFLQIIFVDGFDVFLWQFMVWLQPPALHQEGGVLSQNAVPKENAIALRKRRMLTAYLIQLLQSQFRVVFD